MNRHICRIATLTLSFLLLLIPVLSYSWSGKVVHVADGDTITVREGRERDKGPPIRH